ncbi:hypothetical protein BDU57DRAFT_201496 [Ampelomyces quisqualis]|uniref:Uncharacterized protein n=1 Tax=Ampelomyces quisqualis TaxID=50730 RepID=A0A6A5QSR8_AMPQU|nr:hypothetical protein BDU57DRAFT_201496 [Ampelomyces quisqualis]
MFRVACISLNLSKPLLQAKPLPNDTPGLSHREQQIPRRVRSMHYREPKQGCRCNTNRPRVTAGIFSVVTCCTTLANRLYCVSVPSWYHDLYLPIARDTAPLAMVRGLQASNIHRILQDAAAIVLHSSHVTEFIPDKSLPAACLLTRSLHSIHVHIGICRTVGLQPIMSQSENTTSIGHGTLGSP